LETSRQKIMNHLLMNFQCLEIHGMQYVNLKFIFWTHILKFSQ
jgi:hypothetical protein